MDKGFHIQGNRLLIQGDRLLLVLTPKEVIDAVIADQALFIRACKRGKSELRMQQNEYRTQKADERIAEQIRRSEDDTMQEVMEKNKKD